MNFKHAEILISINEHQNITKAAKELNLKQPTVTFHMKNMESDFGVTLFTHNSGKVLLTDAGNALLHYAEKILLLSRDAENVLKDFSLNEARTFKIGGSMIPSKYILPNLLSSFSNLHPNLHISLTTLSAPCICEMISKFDIDLGIVSTTEEKISSELAYEYICEDEMVLVYSPLSLAGGGAEDIIGCYGGTGCLNSDDMCDDGGSTDSDNTTNFSQVSNFQALKSYIESENFIMHDKKSTTGMLTAQWINENNLNLNSYLEIGSSEIIKSMVISNLGISILPLICVKDEIENGTLLYSKLFNNNFKRGVYVIYNKERVMLPVVSEFITFVKEHVVPGK